MWVYVYEGVYVCVYVRMYIEVDFVVYLRDGSSPSLKENLIKSK